EEELEEERRLAFVGMTRAKDELYLSHARRRDFRGRTFYAVESMFLSELPEKGVERTDLSTGWTPDRAAESWHEGDRRFPDRTWTKRPTEQPAAIASRSSDPSEGNRNYEQGMLVRHEAYGIGRIMDVSGYGDARKVRIHFSKTVDRTFGDRKAQS